ncbi:MAG: copper amine oxidase N-terminal domain-containing protein [Syntrophomonadaceae bacterium]|jgi:hypothetical protein|nr:copper amine oxidase N-terminal domain-containing protein [Syntrophomonadaceae bacterium]
MRKCLVGLLTLLLLLVFIVPAVAADLTLNVNGNVYQPLTSPQLQEGTTLVPLYAIERMVGADVSQSEENIVIQKDQNTLLLTLNSTQASLNDSLITLLQAPIQVEDEIMVPLRAVLEGLGATVDWAGETRTVLVSFQEQRDGMTTEDLLLKSTEALASYNTYKVRADMTQDMQMLNPDSGETDQMEMQMLMEMAIQNEPVLVYAKTEAVSTSPELPEAEDIITEIVINEDGLYMTIPEEGWVKLTIPGMDLQSYLEQSNQDPLKSLQDLSEAGVVISFGQDQEINNRSYWVLNVTMGPASFSQLLNQTLEGIPLPEVDDQNTGEVLSQILQKLFDNMKADMFYNMLINKETLIPEFMNLYSTVEIKTEIPDPENNNEPVSLDMTMQQTGTYEYFDLNESFTIPDLSQAKDLQELDLDSKTEQAPAE